MAENTTAEDVRQVAESLGLTMTAQFVPWSQSRNRGEKDPSLNWIVTLAHKGRAFLTTDYMAGCGHCPSYKHTWKPTAASEAVLRYECEHGHAGQWVDSQFGERVIPRGRQPIMPKLADVLYSLVSDGEAIDHSGFESWARDLGYDTDSRKAEATYRACIDIGLKLRNALGEAGLARLREALQGY